jgi:hypothetical protein
MQLAEQRAAIALVIFDVARALYPAEALGALGQALGLRLLEAVGACVARKARMCSGVLVTVKVVEHHQLSRTWPGPFGEQDIVSHR